MRIKRFSWLAEFSLRGSFISFVALTTQCALPAAPDGGPRDKEPPVILEASVLNGSVNIRETEVFWRFDEYVVLSSPQQNFFSSPPLPVGTTYELRGKTFKVAWPEPLLENSTYVFQWGNTIRDLHEGNVRCTQPLMTRRGMRATY